MPFRRLGGALVQRVALFVLAGLALVFLLHVQVGVVQSNPTAKGTFSAEKWIGASRQYLQTLSRGDLGILKAMRITGYAQDQPVAGVIRQHAPRSLYLLGSALVLSLGLGTLLGIWGSRFGSRWVRPGVLTGTLALLSTPDILLIVLLRKLVIWGMNTFDIQFMSVAVIGQMEPADVIAPALALAVLPMALVARVAAVAFDDTYDQLYIRTAKSKGLHAVRVVWKHAFRNAWIRVAEAGPLIAGGIVTGLVVVEYSFYYPGLGRTLGLLLEKKYPPGPMVSIALALLVGALVLDTVFGAVRVLLDPRLGAAEESVQTMGGGLRLRPLDLLRSLAGAPAELTGWLRTLPYSLRKALWAARPSHLLKELWRNPPLLIGLLGILVLVGLALFGGQLADLRGIQKTPKFINVNDEVFFPPFKPGLPGYPLGSDLAGRGQLERLLVGARYTLFFTLAVTPVRFLAALPWGLIAGFRRGLWAGASRTFGLLLSALPVILVPAALLPLRLLVDPTDGSTANFWLVSAVLAVAGIPRLVETVRQQVEATLVQPFVEGARAAGAGSGRLLFRHVMPHLMPQLWVAAAADMAWTLLLLAQMGVFSIFVGGSAQMLDSSNSMVEIPRLPDWSSMLARPYQVIYKAPWSLWVPALAFTVAIISFNLAAEGLRRRAQQLSAAAAIPDAVMEGAPSREVPAPARRRLALEWTAALVVAALLAGVTAKYGGESTAVAKAQKATNQEAQQTPLERYRTAVQMLLGMTHGTGDSIERSRAAGSLRTTGSQYLSLALGAGVSAAQMQQDFQGHANIFSFDNGIRLLHIQVPDMPMGAHYFFLDTERKTVSYAQGQEKPAYVGTAKRGQKDYVVVTGTIPGPSTWVVSIWERFSDSGTVTQWVRSEEELGKLFARIPPEYTAKLQTSFGNRPQYIDMTGGPLNSARVTPTGDVEVCVSSKGPCATIPWTETGY